MIDIALGVCLIVLLIAMQWMRHKRHYDAMTEECDRADEAMRTLIGGAK